MGQNSFKIYRIAYVIVSNNVTKKIPHPILLLESWKYSPFWLLSNTAQVSCIECLQCILIMEEVGVIISMLVAMVMGEGGGNGNSFVTGGK